MLWRAPELSRWAAITFAGEPLFDDAHAPLVCCAARAKCGKEAHIPMSPQPKTNFDWSMYADATLAGLSVLIPIPFLDSVFETFFRRRMPTAIARSRGRVLPASIRAELQPASRSVVHACLALPLTLTIGLVQRVSRKLLYFLTVKEATETLSQYWHRAFLLDYMLAAGHVETEASAHIAAQAMEQVLATTSSPLTQLARQVIAQTRHIWQTLRGARRGHDDDVIEQTRAQLEQRWGDFAGYFEAVAARYDHHYRELQTQHQRLAEVA